MKGETKEGPWSEREYVSQLPDRFIRLTPYYFINFNSNGGTGEMPTQNNIEYATVTLPENSFTREGYTFTGWNTEADGSGTPYGDKASIDLTGDLTLYAQWKKNEEITPDDPDNPDDNPSHEEPEITSVNTEYQKKNYVKGIMLPIYKKHNPGALVIKTKFKSSNKKVVKVTKNGGVATGGKRTGTATITMYVKTRIFYTNSKGKQKRKLSKWTEAGKLKVNNTGKN